MGIRIGGSGLLPEDRAQLDALPKPYDPTRNYVAGEKIARGEDIEEAVIPATGPFDQNKFSAPTANSNITEKIAISIDGATGPSTTFTVTATQVSEISGFVGRDENDVKIDLGDYDINGLDVVFDVFDDYPNSTIYITGPKA